MPLSSLKILGIIGWRRDSGIGVSPFPFSSVVTNEDIDFSNDPRAIRIPWCFVFDRVPIVAVKVFRIDATSMMRVWVYSSNIKQSQAALNASSFSYAS